MCSPFNGERCTSNASGIICPWLRRETLEKLRERALVRYYGIVLGPAIGWQYEGVNCIGERTVTSLQHIYNVLEQHPGAVIQKRRNPCLGGMRCS